jgi:3-isopropylmalate/(R)-2-methylmalate dehydratase small subunit
MEDPKRTTITGPALAVRGHDIDTDRIIPARYLRCVVFEGLGEHVFEDDRAHHRTRGETHPFDAPHHAGARLLFVNRNFGCGSSREHAPQAIMRWEKGIQAIVGESFAEIFLGNCLALGIPCVTVDAAEMAELMAMVEAAPDTEFRLDLPTLTLSGGGRTFAVSIPADHHHQLLEGRWDTTAELLEGREQIERTADRLPYFRGFP